ncbi:hypothetical protein GCM10018954_091650 [Kutzneria kofuensis]
MLTLALLLTCSAAGLAPRGVADTVAVAGVSVDFSQEQGPLWHGERYNNFTQAKTWQSARASDVAYLNQVGLHGKVYRAWAKVDWCGGSTTSCTLSSDPASPTGDVAGYLADASAVSDSVLLNLDVTGLIQQGKPPAQAKPVIEEIVKTVKTRYPKVKYLEAFNEPDAPQNRGFMTPDKVYPYYAAFYQVANEVNAELMPNTPLRIGGPAFFELDPTWINKFLDDYAADTDPAKRLDFFSYHGYVEFGDMATVQDPHFYKDDPRQVESQHARLQSMFAAHHVDPDLPTFVTETGVYPGLLCDDCADTDPTTTTTPWSTSDYVRQAAGAASVLYWYGNQPDTYAFNWVTRHSSNERKDEFVTRGPGCTSITAADRTTTTTNCPNGPVENTFTPYGNSLLMQSMMKTKKVSATSDSLTDKGLGVYALAAKDKTGASVMVWNYQDTNSGAFHATINLSHLPSNLSGRPVDVKVYRVDQNTSNYYSNPNDTDQAKGHLQQVDERTVTSTGNYCYQAELGPNAMYLVLFTPMSGSQGAK